MAVAELPVSALDELASFDEVSFVSADAETEVLGHVSKTTGDDAAAAQTYSAVTKLDGTGVGIAVIDSGIYDQHASFLDAAGTASGSMGSVRSDASGRERDVANARMREDSKARLR